MIEFGIGFVLGVVATAVLANRKPEIFAKVKKVVEDTAHKIT